MMSETSARQIEINFQPIGRRIKVELGLDLLSAAQMAGVDLISICGGVGICSGCRVRVIEGDFSPPTSQECEMLSEDELDAGTRLACQAIPKGDVRIDIPSESLSTPQRLQIEGQATETKLEPPIKAVDVHVQPPTLEDLRSDWTRLKAAVTTQVPEPRLGIGLARTLPDTLRDQEWAARVAFRGAEVVGLLPVETPPMGLAIDVGTTKLAAYLVNLESGETVAKSGAMNPQIAYGEDVISRIAYANTHPEGRVTLQAKLIDALNDLIHSLCDKAQVQNKQILETVVVGNTAMHHLFSGLPVRQLGEAPYVPVVSEALEVRASDLDLNTSPGAWIYLPPNIAGYVGADHMAMLIATRLHEHDQILMAVDVGTNTEISLTVDGRILSCSCASGPAFEGAHILHGMRAAPGAIERMRFIDGKIHLQTIDDASPVGICGSGILDVVAGLLTEGLLDRRGVFSGSSPNLRSEAGKAQFLLSPASENGHHQDIVVTRQDVNEIQLAKGAIRAGIDILLEKAGLVSEDLDQMIVAGAFGTYIDIESAIRIGMFPDIPLDTYRQVGNAAGAGAKDLLISQKMRRATVDILDRLEYVELTTHADFQGFFMERLYF